MKMVLESARHAKVKHIVSARSEIQTIPRSIVGVGTPLRASLELTSGPITSVATTAPNESAKRRIVVSWSGQPNFSEKY